MEFEFDLENPLPPLQENFNRLFDIENDHMPSKSYLQSLNAADSSLTVRREIVSSIFCFSRNFDPFLAYLAINYMDRFLSIHSVPEGKPWIIKIVAISCISLALKMRKIEFSVSGLQRDGGLIFDSVTIERMEMIILGALKWRMRSVNPFSFLKFFITFFKFKDKPSIQALQDRTTEIILKAQNDVKLLEFKASVISACALLSAAHELFPMQLTSLRDGIYSCSYVCKENLLKCYHLMQDVAIDGFESVLDMGKASSSCTPANVLDLHCLTSSISTSQNNPNPITSDETDNNNNAIETRETDQNDFATGDE